MADISVTATSVVAGANAVKERGVMAAANTGTAGKIVYESSSGQWSLADANVAACSTARIGILANGGGPAQPVEVILEDDDLTPGGTLSISAAADDGVYVLSATAGGFAPVADLAATMYPVVLMVAKSATKAVFKPIQGTGVLTA